MSSSNMYYKETFLIAITLVTTIVANDYHSNEEVTSSSLDFFDSGNNNDFFINPRKQSALRNTFGRGQMMPEPETASLPSAVTASNILTTMVPGLDPVQTISTFTQQLDDEDISNYTTTSSAMNEIAQDHFIFSNTSESEYAEDQDDVIITTTTPSAATRMKQGKQIPISSLQPHEALRKFVEDSYIRRPLAILIDTAQDDLDEIKRLWMDALRPNAPLDCVLLAYNASGVPITYNFTNIRTLLAGINSIRPSENSRGNGFFGIIRAIELIPYDSAVFVSTGLLPIDENLAQYAATALLKKRIRLYLTWSGEKSLTENETHQEAGGILGSVAERSGGEVIFAGSQRIGDYPTDNMVTILTDHLPATQDQELIIEPTVADNHYNFDAALKTSQLETPNGDDQLSRKMLKWFNLSDNKVDRKRENHFQSTRNLLELTHESIRFPDENDSEIAVLDGVIEVEKNMDVNATNSRQEQQATVLQNLGTVIEMGMQSQLLLAPGARGEIYFEVTNYRKEPVFHTFRTTGEQQFLVAMNMQSLLFAPGQTAVVIVTVRVPPSTSIGTKDQITFACQGNGQASKMAILKVTQTTDYQDGSQPSLHWNFGSRCDGNKLEPGLCADWIWSLDVTAHDWGTGLLRIQSNPRGIYARSSYISGTITPVTATYSSTCCQPRVTVSAYDLAGNARTVTIDVRDIYLSEASIAAIVLGALLILLLIIALIILIVWCCKRRDTIDLSTYRTHRRASTT